MYHCIYPTTYIQPPRLAPPLLSKEALWQRARAHPYLNRAFCMTILALFTFALLSECSTIVWSSFWHHWLIICALFISLQLNHYLRPLRFFAIPAIVASCTLVLNSSTAALKSNTNILLVFLHCSFIPNVLPSTQYKKIVAREGLLLFALECD